MRICGSPRNLVRLVFLAGIYSTGIPVSGDPPRDHQFVPADSVFESPRVVARIDLRAGRSVLPVTINGAGPYRMLLDTTARVPLIDIHAMRRAGLTILGTFKENAAVAPGIGSADLMHIGFLAIGGAEFRDFNALAADLSTGTRVRRRLDGVLPLAFFSGLMITLDSDAEQVILEKGELPEPDGKNVLGYTDASGVPMVKLSLKDLTMDFAIDTSSAIALTFPTERKGDVVSAYHAKTGRLLAGPASKKRTHESGGAGLLRLGRHEIVYAPFEFEEGLPTIGWGILQHFTTTFDLRNDRVRFMRRADTPIQFSFSPKFGIELARQGNAMVVVSVFPDSPIDRSVIKVGTKIAEIEGRPARDYTQADLRALMDKRNVILFTAESGGFRMLVPVHAEGH